jgi:hypothetical protein
MKRRPKTKEEKLQISKTKNEASRKEILECSKSFQSEQSNKKLAVPTHRKKKHISIDEYQDMLKKGMSLNQINKTTSKHLTGFYNAMLKGKIKLSKEKFEEMYDQGMSLNDIAKSEKISRDHMTYLREFYGIKRKGATYQKRVANEKPLSQEAKDIIIGSMLGDGHITKWGYYSEKHSPKQLEYLKWKAIFFPHITTETSWAYYEAIDKRSGTLIKTHNFRTTTHSWLQEMEKLWYKKADGKRTKVIPIEIAEWMNPLILAVWFMDDGNTDWKYRNGEKEWKNANPRCKLCTDSFSEEETDKLQLILKLKFSLNSKINKRKRIVFNSENSLRFIKLIKPFTQKSMLYKVDENVYSEMIKGSKLL